MSTTATEKLADGRVAVDEETLGSLVLALGHATNDVALGVSDEVKQHLDADLDPKRVKQVRGQDYIATHDAIRTANRIFGYGRWGHEVVELECVGSEAMKNGKGEQGWYTGYRCTVKLTVAGCVPVSGIGYGDAFEKQWSGRVTTHELAVKEAESDALKRALKNFGDQFGLILYAKQDEKQRIAQAKAEEEYNAPASEADVDELRKIAETLGNEQITAALDAEIAEHGHARSGWMAKALGKARTLAADGAPPAPPAEQPAPAAQEPVSQEDTGSAGNATPDAQNATEGAPGTEQSEGHAAAARAGGVGEPLATDDREASEQEIDMYFELAKRFGPPGMKKASDDVTEQRKKYGGKVSAAWLGVQCEQLGAALKRAAAQMQDTVPEPVNPQQAEALQTEFAS